MGATEIIVRRRKWTPEEKAALLAEIEAEGGHVSVVAETADSTDAAHLPAQGVSKVHYVIPSLCAS